MIIIIYQRLRDLREDLDLKQKDVAEIINTSANYYGDYEKGKREIPLERMIILAKYYNVSLDYIVGLTNSKGGLHKINDEEKSILSLYNGLSDKRKGRVEQLLITLSEEQQEEETKAKEII